MKYIRKSMVVTLVTFFFISINCIAQSHNESLSVRERNIVTISTYTTKGDLTSLNKVLHRGLDSGLTINEIKEVLVHLYAYTGFPRSLQGINTLISILNERKSKGITDKVGRTASPVTDNLNKYERGKKVLETLTGQKETGPKTGYAAFSPEIEIFLKEHLFADLFSRDVISYSDREIATLSALISLGGVEPMIQSHMRIALNLGINESKLNHMIAIIENELDTYQVKSARTVLAKVTGTESNKNTDDSTGMFARGSKAPVERFTGVVWVNMLVEPTDSFGHSTGIVTFEPGARTNWHIHSGGQVLLVTNGRGYYQEKGGPKKVIHKGDVIKCPPGLAHWHGASHDKEMSHVAISSNFEKGSVVWLEKVTDEEYKSSK